jgi:hypothetical protein
LGAPRPRNRTANGPQARAALARQARRLLRFWGELEINCAVALDMGWKSLDEIGEQIVVQAVADLKSLVGAKLSRG